MYQAKTSGFLELLTNALPYTNPRRSRAGRRPAVVPGRREAAVGPSVRDALVAKEMYFAEARLSRWNR